jgi:hypothetical protein
MDKIDLDDIMENLWEDHYKKYPKTAMCPHQYRRDCMKEAARQALVLASEKAIVRPYFDSDGCYREGIHLLSKQSILDVYKLIV